MQNTKNNDYASWMLTSADRPYLPFFVSPLAFDGENSAPILMAYILAEGIPKAKSLLKSPSIRYL